MDDIAWDCYNRVPTAQGKQGKWQQQKSLSGKTQGIWFAQVVNSLILKVKDILIFARLFMLDMSAKSFLCT